jgi:hypothetical protein
VRPAVRGLAAKHGAAKYGGGVRFLFFLVAQALHAREGAASCDGVAE